MSNSETEPAGPLPAQRVLGQLMAGNRRFVEGEGTLNALNRPTRRRALATGQAPCAVVLGCADSRVPVESVFDQGLGDLFVVRVAGNFAKPSQIGSIEYAVANLGTRLVVVLGHTCCGAVRATVDALLEPAPNPSPHLGEIVEAITPAVEPLLAQEPRPDRDALIAQAVRTNVQQVTETLLRESEILRRLQRDEGLLVVGAEYALDTGEVDFFDGVPA